jgi:hypothetical protein
VAGFVQWLADSAGTANVATFAQYGVLGIVASLLVWFAKNAHQRERDRADRLEEENRKLNALILDRVIPALTSATQAAKESTDLLHDLQREQAYAQQERRRSEGK